jgi:signal transduction histidine kinase
MNPMTRHEEDPRITERIARLEAELAELRTRLVSTATPSVHVSGIDVEWDPAAGVCSFARLPVAMMWVDSTLAGLMSGLQAMVGTERFLLALQSEGRKSVEADVFVVSPSDRSLETEIALLHDTMLSRLRKSEEGFRSIVEQSPMGMLLYEIRDHDRLVLTAVNRAAESSLNISGSEFLEMTIEEAFPPLAQTEIPDRYRHIARHGGTWSIQELTYEAQDIKGIYDVLAFQTSPNTVAVNFLDVTERIQAQREREELQAHLHRSGQMESLGLLAGGVAHDLNNILSGLVTYPDVLLAGLSPEDRFYKPLQTIVESGNRAAAVVNDLLTITRASATEKSTLDLNQLVRDHLESPEIQLLGADHAGVGLRKDLADEALPVVGSDNHLRKALTNLIYNAAEACEDKGTVSIRTRRRRLERPLRAYERIEAGDYVVLSVEDDGTGIDPSDLERIFEPFYTRKVLGRSGTGLGLTVVWNTVRDHHGHIDIESDLGGTAFHLYLPASSTSVPPAAVEVRSRSTQRTGPVEATGQSRPSSGWEPEYPFAPTPPEYHVLMAKSSLCLQPLAIGSGRSGSSMNGRPKAMGSAAPRCGSPASRGTIERLAESRPGLALSQPTGSVRPQLVDARRRAVTISSRISCSSAADTA